MKEDYLHQEVEEVKEEVKKKPAKKEKKNPAELSQGTKRTDR